MENDLIIGGSSGDCYRIASARNTDEQIMKHFMLDTTNALEIMFHKTLDIDYQITNELIENYFDHCSIHTPDYTYKHDDTSHKILKALKQACLDLPIKNIVIHPDSVQDRSIFEQYNYLPFSIENMDERKKSCQGVSDLKKIFDANPYLGFTLDFQHAFINDPSMQLAKDLHNEFGDRLVQYHISGYHPKYLHYPLFKTHQDKIIAAVERWDLPIIVESTFDKPGELEKEIAYIKSFI